MSEQTNMSLNATARAMRKLAHREAAAGSEVRHENRRAIRVVPIPEMQVLPGGYLAQRGSDDPLIVYESDVPKIQALAEDPALVEAAKKWCDESKAAHIKSKATPRNPHPEWNDVARDYTGPLNWSHAFRLQNHRACRPLLSVEVDEETLPPPQSQEEIKSMAQTEAIVKAVMAAMQNTRAESSDKGRRGK